MAEVRLFREDDRDLGVSTMVRAFANDGLYRYFIPEDGNRGRFLEKFMTFRLRYGLKYGTVLAAGEGASAKPRWLTALRKWGPPASLAIWKHNQKRTWSFTGPAASGQYPTPLSPVPGWSMGECCGRPVIEHPGGAPDHFIA